MGISNPTINDYFDELIAHLNAKNAFCMNHNLENDTFYISIFIDEFNISNQLLSKKTSQNNQIIGIYMKLLVRNTNKFLSHSNVTPIALIKSDIFHLHAPQILKFIGDEITAIIDNKIEIECDSLNFSFDFKIVYFSLDSLSASHLLGMKMSFNHTYCCRFCLTKRSDFKNTFFQKDVFMRTSESFSLNYNNYIVTNEESNGVINKCLLDFFPIKDLNEICPPCFAHDILEGIAPRIFKFCLQEFRKSFPLNYQILINMVTNFSFKSQDKSKFPKIFFENLSLNRFIASETHYLFRFMPFFLIKSGFNEDELNVKLFLMMSEIILHFLN